MGTVMPQEIEVWFLLPGIRRELAIFLTKKHKLRQQEVAIILGITEAAVSQYISKKRGMDISFNKKEKSIIETGSDNIIKDKSAAPKIIYALSLGLRGSKTMCDVHMMHDKNIPHNCKLCRV
jgi:uncharacterized protein